MECPPKDLVIRYIFEGRDQGHISTRQMEA